MKDIVNMAAHAVGMGNKTTFTKYGKECFISYRNYYSVSPDGHPDWEELVRRGLAMEYASNRGVTYHLTEAGMEWLQKETEIVIYDEDHPEEDYDLAGDDIDEINQIWGFIKDNNIYAWNNTERLDVEILIESDMIDNFCEQYVCDSECSIPAGLTSYGVSVKFTDMLSCKASGKQIWKLRPKEGMREEL